MAFQTSDINNLFERMKANQMKVMMGLTRDEGFNADFFLVSDPDDNVIQIIEPVGRKK